MQLSVSLIKNSLNSFFSKKSLNMFIVLPPGHSIVTDKNRTDDSSPCVFTWNMHSQYEVER